MVNKIVNVDKTSKELNFGANKAVHADKKENFAAHKQPNAIAD